MSKKKIWAIIIDNDDRNIWVCFLLMIVVVIIGFSSLLYIGVKMGKENVTITSTKTIVEYSRVIIVEKPSAAKCTLPSPKTVPDLPKKGR